MLTASQVCEVLGISPDTLKRLNKAGEFPGAMRATPRPTGHWRIPEKSLEDYLKRNAVIPEPESARS